MGIKERTEVKDTRLHVRCRTEDKEKIERAAAVLGLSVSDYLLSNALAQVERQTAPVAPVHEPLSETDTRSLLAYLFAEPAEPTAKMRKAVARYKALVKPDTDADADL
ncbi:MAG: DUF1778 domain-containing protein [Armatimonas sp.]